MRLWCAWMPGNLQGVCNESWMNSDSSKIVHKLTKTGELLAHLEAESVFKCKRLICVVHSTSREILSRYTPNNTKERAKHQKLKHVQRIGAERRRERQAEIPPKFYKSQETPFFCVISSAPSLSFTKRPRAERLQTFT